MTAYLITDEPCCECGITTAPGWIGPRAIDHCQTCGGTGRRLVTLAEAIAAWRALFDASLAATWDNPAPEEFLPRRPRGEPAE